MEITLKGRTVPLLFTTYEMKTMQEEVAPNEKLTQMLVGKNPDAPDDPAWQFAGAEHLGVVAKVLRILGNAGLEEAGEAPDLTDKKILRALKPMELSQTVNACLDAIGRGFASEVPAKEADGPVDVTLEEINKKKEKDD